MCSSTDFIAVGDLNIPVRRKNIKHVHIAVYPPDGYVCISAPLGRRSEVIRAFALTKLGWIKARQAEGYAQARARGAHLGRPAAQLPADWEEIVRAWKAGQITGKEAQRRAGIGKTKFYQTVRGLSPDLNA